MRIVAIALMVFLYCSPALAFCTDGIDCYCDRVAGGDLNDTLILLCEDWESPNYYLGTSTDFSATSTTDRGNLAEFVAAGKWPGSVNSGHPQGGQPSGTPYKGPQCVDAGHGCSGIKEFCSAAQGTDAGITTTGGGDDGINCWGSSSEDMNISAYVDIQRDSNED